MHLQIAKWVTEKTGERYLIVAPLGVRQEFTRSDGPKMGLEIEYVRTNEEAKARDGAGEGVQSDAVRFGGVSAEIDG